MVERFPGRTSQLDLRNKRQRLERLIESIVREPELASFWAEHCGWVPGTGSCRHGADIECRGRCPFAVWREREMEQLRRERRRRRVKD